MDGYRLYFFDPQRGRIQSFREFEAEHDGAALEEADRLRSVGPMELWCHARKVKQWPSLFAPLAKEMS
jgi:hypothetical protein